MVFEKTIFISEKLANKINSYLNATKDDEYQGEDSTIRKTVVFPDGVEMDIKCCGCEDESSWTEAVLFLNGSEICCSEVSEDFVGEWELEYDGNIYKVNVVVEKYKYTFSFISCEGKTYNRTRSFYHKLSKEEMEKIANNYIAKIEKKQNTTINHWTTLYP